MVVFELPPISALRIAFAGPFHKRKRHRVSSFQQAIGAHAVAHEVAPIDAIGSTEHARTVAAKTATPRVAGDGEQVLRGDDQAGHFLPPPDLIGSVPIIFQASTNSSLIQTSP